MTKHNSTDGVAGTHPGEGWVGVCSLDQNGEARCSKQCGVCSDGVRVPPAGPLTDMQVFDLLPDPQSGWTLTTYGLWVARAVERAHGIHASGVTVGLGDGAERRVEAAIERSRKRAAGPAGDPR